MKICTLIPAYKPKYLADLLGSLRAQTLQPSRILFSDDSPNGEFRQALRSEDMQTLAAGLEIEVVEGPRNGAFENFKHLVRLWNGESELFHILLDDDVIYPEFYERHLLGHQSGKFSCSISRRWEADEHGLPMRGQAAPQAVALSMQRMIALSDDVAFMTTVAESKNWFGEFSNAVFRRECADLVLEPRLTGISYAGLWDLGAFLAASTRQPICYIQDHLGFFRKGPDQNSAQAYSSTMKGGVLAYAALAIAGRRLGKMSDEQSRKCFATISGAVNYWYAAQDDLAAIRAVLPALAAGADDAELAFADAWNTFLLNNGF